MFKRLNLAILGLLAMIGIMVAIATAQVAASAAPDPEAMVGQCGTCHTMEEQVHAWQESAHKEVACTECHADTGFWGWTHRKISQVRMNFADRAESADAGDLEASVPNSRCLNCHSLQMPLVMLDLKPAKVGEPTPDRDTLKPLSARAGHDIHLSGKAALQCTSCHAEVAHSTPTAEVKATVSHQTCQACHDKEQVRISVPVTVSCAACHTDLKAVAPPDHKEQNWYSAHGDAALPTAESCGECHLMPGSGTQQGVASAHGQPKVIFANNLFAAPENVDGCQTCHGEPMPHRQGFLQEHGSAYKARPAVCAQCHADGADTLDMTVWRDPKNLPNSAFCQSCHGTEMPHPDSFLNAHGKAAAAAPESCASCHSDANPVNPQAAHATQAFCSNCHSGLTMPHSQAFAGSHGKAARQSPAVCSACHSSANPVNPQAAHSQEGFCLDCHLSADRHPAGWLTGHKLAVQQAGSPAMAGCTTCHTETRNSCASCHTGQPGDPWHPDPYWFITHGRDLTPAKEQGCATCHNEVKPRCSQCHADR